MPLDCKLSVAWKLFLERQSMLYVIGLTDLGWVRVPKPMIMEYLRSRCGSCWLHAVQRLAKVLSRDTRTAQASV